MAYAPTPRRGGRILNGIGALTAVAVITALPVLLLWAAGNPASSVGRWLSRLGSDPSDALTQLWEAGSSRDDGTLLLHVLTLAGWIAAGLAAWAWATFLIAFVAELATQLSAHRRGHVARSARLPGMRIQQRAAAALAAAIIGVFAAPALASAAPTPINPPATTATHAAPTKSSTAPTAAGAAATSNNESRTAEHIVQRGEGLLDIAERYGMSWQRLAEANYGKPQPDGQTLQRGSLRVYPGWSLTVPGAGPTSTQDSAATATDADPIVYRVARGDRLHDIAERFFGDGDRYPEIARANPTLERRDSRFPNHIEAGWKVTLPDGARDRGAAQHATGRVLPTAPVAASADHKPSTLPSASEKEDHRPTPASSVPTPRPSTPAASTDSRSPAATTPASTANAATNARLKPSDSASAPTAAAASPVTAADGGTDDDSALVLTSLAGAGLLSTLLLASVLRGRRRQQQHRRPRRQLPNPQDGATERALRVAAQPADVERLDEALRSLAAAVAHRDPSQLPDITAAWITDQAVTVVLSEPCPAPEPWSTEDGVHWLLPGEAMLPPVDEQLAPLPTLVAVGAEHDRHLLIDLERLGRVTVTGDPERSAGLLRYLASELACNNWSDDVEVIIAGFPPDEAELLIALNPDRMRAVGSVSDVAARLRRRITAVRSALAALGVTNTFAGRAVDVGEAWSPQVVLALNPTDEDLAALAEIERDLPGGRCAVAIASTATTEQGGHVLVVESDGTLNLTLPRFTATGRAAGLPVRELRPLAEIMRQARATADEPTPPAPEPEPWAADADTNGALRLFDPSEPEPPTSGDGWDELVTHTDISPSTAEADGHAPTEPILKVPQISLPATPARREVTAAIRQRRRQVDPQLDADLRAWREQDRTRPRIGILGPVTVEAPGPAPDQRRRFHAEIIVYLAQRGARGASAEQFTEALWPTPGQPIKDTSRRVAISRARRWLGQTPDGREWLPEMGADRVYRLEEGYLLDWHLFRRLRSRGEAHGPAGVRDLRAALELVRGAPLDGADRAYAAGARNPYTWLPESDIYPGHLVSGVVDTAHQLAELYLDAGDTTGARWAVGQAWLADPHRGDDGPWRDLMRAAQMDGHAAEMRNLLAELMRTREAEVPEDLSKETYAWLRPLLPEVLAGSY